MLLDLIIMSLWAKSIVLFLLFKYLKIHKKKRQQQKYFQNAFINQTHKTKVHTNHSNATNKYNERFMCKTCQTCWSQTGKCFTKRIYWSIERKIFSNALLMHVHRFSDHFGWFEILPIPAEDCWRLRSSLKVKRSLNASSLGCCEHIRQQSDSNPSTGFPSKKKKNCLVLNNVRWYSMTCCDPHLWLIHNWHKTQEMIRKRTV